MQMGSRAGLLRCGHRQRVRSDAVHLHLQPLSILSPEGRDGGGRRGLMPRMLCEPRPLRACSIAWKGIFIRRWRRGNFFALRTARP
jgi:hypothetical protein